MSAKYLYKKYISPILKVLLITIFIFGCKSDKPETMEAYLFAYFTGNEPGQEAIHFAVSKDGYHYRALNNNKPILQSREISSSGGVRDPHVLRSEHGDMFYMVATDLYVPEQGWNNFALVFMTSNDLINWQSSVVNIPETFPAEFADVNRVWAPQTIYDEVEGKYMVYFSMRKGEGPDILYYAYANKDFSGLEEAPKQLYFPPENSNTRACIDADIIPYNEKYYLFHKAEDSMPGIKLAVSDKLTEGYQFVKSIRENNGRAKFEGSSIYKLNNTEEYILMYDVYTRGTYQFSKSTDLENFEVNDGEFLLNFKPRHGSVMSITERELKRLVAKWGSLSDPLVETTSSQLKERNVAINGDSKTIHLPLKSAVDLDSVDPGFEGWGGFTVRPDGAQDFSKGPVDYTFTINGRNEVYKVSASEDHNPVLDGYYADPEVLYSEKTRKFYIYPTSDGFQDWGGYYFKVFSSEDMIDWKDEGIIIDLKKEGEVTWANRNAWAPCIIEKKIDGEYKYFFYFTAAQTIGVAVGDAPTGPFVDSGKPLIDFKPQDVNYGQEIDPDVFTDPDTGKSYIYWGNGYMAGAELNDDMVSIKEETLKRFNVDKTYREGTYVIYRNGTYYFMWSEDDTRSPNYKVRYGTADSPLGKLTIPENNIVIQRDSTSNIVGTGHNSAIQIPGKDEWYIVYHRFTYPNGQNMPGGSGGFHREVCIDKLEFDSEGNILETTPTLKGINSVNLK